MKILPQEIIAKKRNGKVLTADDIYALVDGITNQTFTDSQISAMAMAIYLNGMDISEAVALTLAMRDSGDVLDWQNLDGPVLDKHSTGGIGDNVSLMLAPAIAVCGGYVPMISGRGLGHSGGTLDKLDSIPNYQTQPSVELFRKVVEKIGCAIIGQTENLAPADKRFYSIRDITATVESIPLITASILSKKLASGLQGLVLDIKCGNGAFMQTKSQAQELGKSLAMVATGAGLACEVLITDMNSPLATSAGNGLEIQNAIDFLTGKKIDERLWQVVVELGGHLLKTGALVANVDEGKKQIEQAFNSKQAAQCFAKMVSELGGPNNLLEKPENYLPKASVTADITSETSGTIYNIDTRAIGLAVVKLGGGRLKPTDKINYSVGFSNIAKLGDEIAKGEPLARIHATSEEQAQAITKEFIAAFKIGDEKPQLHSPIIEKIKF